MKAEELASFVPWRLTSALVAAGGSTVSVRGALLFADISGFTALANALAARYGAGGAERLSTALNAYFGVLLTRVRTCGGEVVKFAGDGILANFPAGEGDPGGQGAAMAATRCGFAMLESAAAVPAIEGVALGLHTAVSVGDTRAVAVGGHRGRWDVALVGDNVQALSATFADARRGWSVVSGNTARLLGEKIETEPLPGGVHRVMRILEPGRENDDATLDMRLLPAGTDRRIVEQWLPEAVVTRAASPLSSWLAEIRTLTPLFLNFPGLETGDGDAEKIATAVRVSQEELSNVHGVLHEVAVDDKGVFLTAAFGLPGSSVERGPENAVRASIAIRERLAPLGIRTRAGVATGRVFVGPIGDDWRRELAVIGPAMNLAARLAFEEGEDVAIDETTRGLAEDTANFEELPPRPVRGFGPTRRWRVVSSRRRTVRSRHGQLVGRIEQARILDEADAAHRDGQGAVVVIEGSAGIGKSRLVAHAVARARDRPVPIIEVIGDVAGAERPWSALRPALEGLLGIEERKDPARRLSIVRSALERIPRGNERAPLLAPALGLEIADTEDTALLLGPGRARGTAELVADLFARNVGPAGCVVVAEDLQWIDPASADALHVFRDRLTPCLVVLSLRTGDSAPAPAAAALRDLPETRVITLGALPAIDVERLAAERLGLTRVPAELSHWLAERSHGNPFVAGELASALLAQGALRVEAGEVAGEVDAADLDALLPTPNVEAAVTRRFDVLPPAAQLTLKVASIVGMRFHEDALRAAHPMGEHSVGPSMEALEIAGLCVRGEHGEWTFGHRITLDVAYSLMLDEQRVRLHGLHAMYLAAAPAPDPAALAWHCERAGQIERALQHLEASWIAADRAGTLAEAHAMARRALRLLRREDAPRVEPVVPARWWRRKAEHSCHLGLFPRAYDEASNALRALDNPLPANRGAWRRRLFSAMCVQAWYRFAPRMLQASRRTGEVANETAHSVLRAAEGLTFSQPDRLVALACFVDAANHCERAGIIGRAANALGVMGVALSAMGASRAGRYYLDSSLREAEGTGDGRLIATSLFHHAVSAASAGRWEESDQIWDKCAARCSESGNQFLLNFVWAARALNALAAGRYREAEAVAAHLSPIAARDRNLRGISVAALTQALVALGRGDFRRAEELARDARDRLRRNDDVTWLIAASVLARVLLRLGRTDAAVAEATSVLDVLATTAPADPRRLEAFAGPAEVLTALRLTGRSEARHAESLAVLERFSRTFKIGSARLALLRGFSAQAADRRSEAVTQFQAAIRHAGVLNLRLDACRARLALQALGEAEPEAERERAWLREEGIHIYLDAPPPAQGRLA